MTLNGSQVSEYLVMMPPSFEEWTSQGPQARPLPSNSNFSRNYVYEDDSDEEEYDSDEEYDDD